MTDAAIEEGFGTLARLNDMISAAAPKETANREANNRVDAVKRRAWQSANCSILLR